MTAGTQEAREMTLTQKLFKWIGERVLAPEPGKGCVACGALMELYGERLEDIGPEVAISRQVWECPACGNRAEDVAAITWPTES